MKAIAKDPKASLLDDVLYTLGANADKLAAGIATGLNAIASTLSAKLQAAGFSAAAANAAAEVAKTISAASIKVDADNISGKDASGRPSKYGSIKDSYKPASGATTKSTSGAFAAVVSVGVMASALVALF